MIVQTNDIQELVVDGKAYILLEELDNGFKYECVDTTGLNAEALEIRLVKAIKELLGQCDARARLAEVYRHTYKAKWLEKQMENYLVEYKDTREMTNEEKLVHDTEEVEITDKVTIQVDSGEVDENGEVILVDSVESVTRVETRVVDREEGYIYPLVNIPREVIFEEYLVDKDYVVIDVQELVNANKWIEEYEVKVAKEAKLIKLSTITVEVNGKVFDGNESARNNMLASIKASQLLGIESTYWKLADNTVVEVTADEIKEALALSIQRVGEIVTNE